VAAKTAYEREMGVYIILKGEYSEWRERPLQRYEKRNMCGYERQIYT